MPPPPQQQQQYHISRPWSAGYRSSTERRVTQPTPSCCYYMDFRPHLISTVTLANRFHIIYPDYPGFGNSDMPDRSKFVYTFDRLAEFVEGLLKQIRFTQFGLYVQHYGGPIGFRIINRHPDWLD